MNLDKDTNAKDCTANNLYNVLPAVPSIVYNDDCMHGLKRFPDKCFDLAIVDPPYGKNADKGTNGFGSAKNRKYKGGWDSKTPDADYWQELRRVSKNQIVWGGNYFIENLTSTNCFIVWDKVGEYNFKNPFAQVELAWTSFTGVSKKVTIVQQGFVNSNETVIHPTQKPVKLYEWILMNYASDGDLILDTHVGSGSSRIACANGGFNFVGFEIDKGYFDAQEKRFKLSQMQTRLF